MNSTSVQMTKPSVLAPDLEVTGNIHSTGDLIVQAQVTGDIAASTVAVHQWANVNGDIQSKQLIVDGRVDGHVVAGSVTVSQSGQIMGSLHYSSLVVEAGAEIGGHLRKVAPDVPPQK